MSEQFTIAGSIDRAAAEPFEVGVVQWVRRPGEGGREALSAGYWFVSPDETPGPMLVVGHADETVHIVEGRVRIEPKGGEPIELTAGGSASLNKGVPATWTVLEPTVEFFVYS
ncbi:cupin domain-containing protein [Microbacterium sp. HD4P20]|uniref:cupin domain-containing protein n=1 Tax=Microbacterium sp. HD4P20 TaxID=2864874 RepID=UPI001C63BD06|nr:cupin domain-containing protein [Microbacterium sp. HD4P20]MCP2635526.1 cupin domain-containing protein [Microbacterium sp. HD4P20]